MQLQSALRSRQPGSWASRWTWSIILFRLLRCIVRQGSVKSQTPPSPWEGDRGGGLHSGAVLVSVWYNHPNKQLVLSITKADCEGNAYDYPCYTARRDGHADNSDYVSIEYSTGYEGFSPGYYIVVAAIGAPGSSVVSAVLASARKWYPNAYAKQTRIWHGCML